MHPRSVIHGKQVSKHACLFICQVKSKNVSVDPSLFDTHLDNDKHISKAYNQTV